MSDVSFLYVRDETNFPVGTLAYKSRRLGDELIVSYAYSCYNRKDEFSKAEGRRITVQRLDSNPLEIKGTVADGTDRLLVRALREVAKDPINHWKANDDTESGKYSRLGHRFKHACYKTAKHIGSVTATHNV